MPHLEITHYTDPICPYAFSAEPRLRRLEWRLGAHAQWRVRLVGLAARVEDLEARGLTGAALTSAFIDFGERYGMPMDHTPRHRPVASMPSCRAITAAGFASAEALTAMLRAVRVRMFAGDNVDEEAVLRDAATDAGLDPDEIIRQAATPLTKDTLADDMSAARKPSPEALAQPERLAPWESGLRYTCPSLEFVRSSDGRRIAAPGFQPNESYDVAVANLLPTVALRPPAETVLEVLEWAPFPLATVEVAAVCARPIDDIRQELRRVADIAPVGPDGYWTITSD